MAINILKNLTIRIKLYLMAFSVSAFLLIVGGLTYYFIKEISDSVNLISDIENFSNDISKLRIAEENFLLSEQTNRIFLSTGKSNYLDSINTYYKKSLKWIDASNNNNALSQQKQNISEISADLNKHKITFDNLAETIKNRGHDDNGIAGQLNQTGRRLNNFSDEQYIIDKINELKVSEKNYLLKKKEIFKDELIIKIDALKDDIERTLKADTTNSLPEFIRSLDLYKIKFEKLSELDNKIGLTENIGLKEEVRVSIEKINANVDSIVINIRQSTEKQTNTAIFIIILVICLLIITIIVSMIFFASNIAKPFELFRDYIIRLGKGELPERFTITSKAEIGAMANAINELTDNLKNTKKFVVEVGNGNLETEVNVFNNQGDLGGSLVEMRQELLKISKEREKQEHEDEKRNWGTRGLALFNDILRQSNIKLDNLGYQILKELVEYLNAVQGAIFIVSDEDTTDIHMELTSTYAYNRRKYISKRIEVDEGLVGRCFQEKHTLYMTKIPNDHFEITSGLGKSNPRSILITPLIVNEEVYGVIEIASYNEIGAHEIDFAEKIAETVAATISNIKINLRTEKLLKETKIQAEQLSSKEDEMRQNMEMLKITQEEAAKKEAIATGFVNSVNHSIIRADYNIDGTIEYVNSKFTGLMEYKSKEMKGKHISMFIDDADKEEFNIEWKRVAEGGKHIEREMRYKTKTGSNWFLATYTPIRDFKGHVVKILYLAIDIEDQKSKNLEFEESINAINRTVIKSEYKVDGTIISANGLFLNTLGYKWDEIKGETVYSFIDEDKVSRFKAVWKKVLRGLPYERQVIRTTKTGDQLWLQGSFTAVKDFDGRIYKVIHIAYDVTQQRNLELEAKSQAKELRQQEETLKNSLAEMTQTEQEMQNQQKELKETNTRLKDRESQLNLALKEAKEKGDLLYAQSEEVTATQEEIFNKQEILEKQLNEKTAEIKRLKAKIMELER